MAESARQIEGYETAVILAEWSHEALQVGGASSEERRVMLTYCLQEFTSLRWGDNGPVKRAITYLHNHQSELLSFVVRMERASPAWPSKNTSGERSCQIYKNLSLPS